MLRILLSALFVLSLAASTFGQSDRQSPPLPAKPHKLIQVWKLDATYTDQQHGVTLRYPSTWRTETGFGYHPPALTAHEKPIAGFGYQPGPLIGPYSQTNLQGFGIVYAPIRMADAAECEARASALAPTYGHRIVVLGGRTFSEYKTADAGMSKSISGKLYATYVPPVCYLFETDVAMISTGVMDGIQALTPEQLRFIESHLLNIMKSVRIVPPRQQ